MTSLKKHIQQRTYATSSSDLEHLPDVLQRIYSSRDVKTADELDYSLKYLLPPHTLKGMSEAVTRLTTAVTEQQKVVIVGDFDADGATSTAVAIKALASFGLLNVGFEVPNRFEYGYGLSPEIVEQAALQKPDVIVTVDNGISSIEGVAKANALGIDVIVTDHHLPGDEVPDATAIVNPNQLGCTFACKSLAGVGVIFYVMLALRSALRDVNWFEQQAIPEPNLVEFLDLVALGTVADVVPLDRVNRILIQQGLQRIRAGKASAGIMALLAIGKRDYRFTQAQDLAFAVAPRLNAAGRMDDMTIGITCLLSQTQSSAELLAQELDQLNHDRRDIEAAMQREAEALLSSIALDENALPNIICLHHSEWHQGVVGIVASRIKERYHRPVIAFALAEDGVNYKGSGRSIAGVHLRDFLDRVAKQAPALLQKFGGHAMAAGLMVKREHIDDLVRVIQTVGDEVIEESVLQEVVMTDGRLAKQELTLGTAKQLANAGPWGQHFPEPIFNGEFQVINQRVLAEKHIKMVLAPKQLNDNEKESQQIVDAIYFNADKTWLNALPEHVSVVYKMDVNRFRGQENLQLIVDYLEAV